MNKIKFYINIIDVIVCFIRIYLYFCIINEDDILARLSEKEQQFVLDFVKSSGSLKDMAKNIGVSYPTVRNMLDDIIDKLTKMDM